MRTLLVLLLLLVAAPAAHARTGPCRTGDVPRVTAKRDTTKAGERYAVVACSASRRMRVLRRTRVGDGAGRGIAAAALAGRHVVWGELVYRGRRRPVSAVVVEADRRGHVTRRRTVWRARLKEWYEFDVAVLRDGSVAWSAPRGRSDMVVVLDRPGRRPVAISPSFEGALATEDGRTLRWDQSTDPFAFAYRDVLPIPLRDGCPRRSRFETLLETAEHRVTEATYDQRDENTLVGRALRVCVRAERRDVVVSADENGGSVSLLSADRAVVWDETADKYGCYGESVTRVSLRRPPAPRRFSLAGECGEGPAPRVPQVVTPAGGVAWIDEPEPAQEPVLRATSGDQSVVLDRGAITDLRADGETYRWRNGGVVRSAPAPR